MSPEDMRAKLLERTIAIIANEGLDKTTTKAITAGTGINEAYIYRHFIDKTDLLVSAFDKLDEELIEKIMQHLPIMHVRDIEYELRARIFFNAIWNIMITRREHCLAFVQYYYSPYFARHSAKAHRERFTPVVEAFKVAFIEEADVWMILNHILNIMLDFAVKVHYDQMSKEDDYTEHVFRVTYRSVEQYFKENKGE